MQYKNLIRPECVKTQLEAQIETVKAKVASDLNIITETAPYDDTFITANFCKYLISARYLDWLEDLRSLLELDEFNPKRIVLGLIAEIPNLNEARNNFGKEVEIEVKNKLFRNKCWFVKTCFYGNCKLVTEEQLGILLKFT